ncbi:MAG: hypothetical protein WD851_23785 [Pirellulales bacterium]
MPTVELTTEQVLELVRQLPPEGRRTAILALAREETNNREKRLNYAEGELQRLCSERGLHWDRMSEDEREAFIDDLIHEDRSCRSSSRQG